MECYYNNKFIFCNLLYTVYLPHVQHDDSVGHYKISEKYHPEFKRKEGRALHTYEQND